MCVSSLAYKPKSVYIAMISLMGLTTAHHKLVELLERYCCISMFGRIWVAMDRFLEFVNFQQQRRGTAFKAFDEQLQFSEYIKPLMHCDAAWREADGPGIGLDDGIPGDTDGDLSTLT